MRYTRLGPLRVSSVGLGLWQLGSRSWGTRRLHDATEIIKTAIEHGIIFYDTAEVYGWGKSETLLGDALVKLEVKNEVIVASKIAGFRTTPYTILKAAKGSRKRLKREPDILQYHWPPPFHANLCRVARGLENIIEEGLAHYIGLSNFNTALMEKILYCFHKHEPISLQIQYNLAYRIAEKSLIPLARRLGMGIIAWSPLAKGGLAGLQKASAMAQYGDKVFKASTDAGLQQALGEIAERHRATKAQVAIAWLISKGALPIPGTRKVERVIEYSSSVNINLSNEEVELLDKASEKFIEVWGKDYNALQWLRIVPSPLQWLFVRLLGGI